MSWKLTYTDSKGIEQHCEMWNRNMIEREKTKLKREGCKDIKMVELDFHGKVIREFSDDGGIKTAIILLGSIFVGVLVMTESPYTYVVFAVLIAILGIAWVIELLKAIF